MKTFFEKKSLEPRLSNYKDYYYKYKALKYYLKNNSIEKQKQIKGGSGFEENEIEISKLKEKLTDFEIDLENSFIQKYIQSYKKKKKIFKENGKIYKILDPFLIGDDKTPTFYNKFWKSFNRNDVYPYFENYLINLITFILNYHDNKNVKFITFLKNFIRTIDIFKNTDPSYSYFWTNIYSNYYDFLLENYSEYFKFLNGIFKTVDEFNYFNFFGYCQEKKEEIIKMTENEEIIIYPLSVAPNFEKILKLFSAPITFMIALPDSIAHDNKGLCFQIQHDLEHNDLYCFNEDNKCIDKEEYYKNVTEFLENLFDEIKDRKDRETIIHFVFIIIFELEIGNNGDLIRNIFDKLYYFQLFDLTKPYQQTMLNKYIINLLDQNTISSYKKIIYTCYPSTLKIIYEKNKRVYEDNVNRGLVNIEPTLDYSET